MTAFYPGTSLAQHAGSSGGQGAQVQMAPNPPSKAELDAIAREEARTNVGDAATLLKLAAQLKADLDENQDNQTLSATAARKAEQIEKLAHRIKTRLKH